MVEFETKETKDVKFGNNKFLEVARKIAKTPEGENEFISISKGFIAPTGQKRFKNALGFPAEASIVKGLVSALESLRLGEEPDEEEEEEESEEEEEIEADEEEEKQSDDY
jgi:hypothetical protein